MDVNTPIVVLGMTRANVDTDVSADHIAYWTQQWYSPKIAYLQLILRFSSKV